MPLCTYCKDTGDTLDHVVPVSFNATSRKKVKFNKADVVPCCGDCNNLLGNVFLHTVGSRAGFLAEKYKKRFKKLLKSPDWSEEELLELGESLSKTLRQANILKKEIEI